MSYLSAVGIGLAVIAASETASPGEPPAKGKAGSSQRRDIPANTWMPAKAEFALPADIKDARWVTTDGYCGSTFRTASGEIISRSGVRSKAMGLTPGFYSNATLGWNLSTGKVRVIDVARHWGGGSYGGGRLLAGFKQNEMPTPRHTYDGLTYVPETDTMYFVLGANWRIGGRGADEAAKRQLAIDNRSTWKYSFKTGRWTRIDHNVYKFFKCSPYEAHLQYWPEGKKLLFLNDGGSKYAQFDLATEKWSQVKLASRCPQSLYNARSTWDSKRALWVFRLGPKTCTFDPKTSSFTALPDAYDMPADRKDKRRSWKGIVYIPKHDTYLMTGPTGNETRVLKAGEAKWRTIAGGEIELVNGYPQYDPKTDRVGLIYQTKAFLFRYDPQK